MNATGDYVLPLDADDILMESCLEEINEVAENSNADIIAPSFTCFGVSQNTVTLMKNPKIEDFKVGNRIGYFSAIKREALLECGGYSPKMVEGYEDLHLWYDLLTRGKEIITIPKPLVLYRTKDTSMITESVKHHAKLMSQINKDFNL